MSLPTRDRAGNIWRQLSARHQWHLVADEDAFLDQVLAQTMPNPDQDVTDEALRVTINGLYSERLYQGLAYSQERAAAEIRLMFVRLALRDSYTESDAEDLAQETIIRVFDKLEHVHSPRQFIAWTMMVLRTTQRDLRAKAVLVVSDLPTNDAHAPDPPDPHDLVAAVEQRLLEQELRDQLRIALPNHLERLTLLRCVILDDDPRDVARDLGLPLYRTRSAKSRALQRLRTNPTFLIWLKSYRSSESTESSPSGGPAHAENSSFAH